MERWFKALAIRARSWIFSAVGGPARKVMKWSAWKETQVEGVATCVEYAPRSEQKEGTILLLESLDTLHANSPFWHRQYSIRIKTLILSEVVENFTYGTADSTCVFNPWTAAKLEDPDATRVFNAALLVMALCTARLLKGERGPLGVCFSSQLAIKAGIRFLKKANEASPNEYFPIMEKELRMAMLPVDFH